MGEFPRDVLRFVERRFARKDIDTVHELISTGELRTPRVLRAVLFLSNGSLSLLRHYLDESHENLAEILTSAEFIVGVPEAIRDFSLPFDHERNVESVFTRKELAEIEAARDRLPRRPPRSCHPHLSRRRFKLGEVMYLIASTQVNPNLVNCYRMAGKVSSIVTLPLVFVLEQLAEPIELEARR